MKFTSHVSRPSPAGSVMQSEGGTHCTPAPSSGSCGGSTCRPPARCTCPPGASAVEVVPLRVTEGDLLAPSSWMDADQRPASRRAVVRRRRRERRNQAVHRAVAGAGIHASTGVLAPGVERGHVLTRIGVALGVGNLELDVPERGRAVVAVDVAAEQRRQRWVANDVAARDRAARVLPPECGYSQTGSVRTGGGCARHRGCGLM